MTDKAKKRRKELAKQLGISERAAGAIIAEKTRKHREERAKKEEEKKP